VFAERIRCASSIIRISALPMFVHVNQMLVQGLHQLLPIARVGLYPQLMQNLLQQLNRRQDGVHNQRDTVLHGV
jgi:hypothetical protein